MRTARSTTTDGPTRDHSPRVTRHGSGEGPDPPGSGTGGQPAASARSAESARGPGRHGRPAVRPSARQRPV